MTELTITVDDYPSLKKHFDLAVEEHQKEFVFKGRTLVTEYAKYVLEYLKPLQEKQRMSRYQKMISDQITEFETPPNCTTMTSVELVEYHEKMETVGYKINVYGPERCLLFRTFAEAARSEIVNRYQA